MTEIEEKIEKLQDISARISGLLQTIQHVRDIAADEIGGEGLTMETCERMSEHLKILHKLTAQLHNGGHSIHQSMQPFVPDDANEGNKDWPPQP